MAGNKMTNSNRCGDRCHRLMIKPHAKQLWEQGRRQEEDGETVAGGKAVTDRCNDRARVDGSVTMRHR